MLPTEGGRRTLGRFVLAVAQQGCSAAAKALPMLPRQLFAEVYPALVVVIEGRDFVVLLLVHSNVPVCAWPEPWWHVVEP